MKINDWLKQSTKQLADAGIGTARLDCLVLLADCLDKNQAQILAMPNHDLTIEQQNWLGRRLLCRAGHEPLAYIRGKTEFYGREFIITPAVLEPRPESETMIDLLKTLPKTGEIIDVGTGSGALAITAALELPRTEVTAIDIDPLCLDVTKQNAANHEVLIKCKRSYLLHEVTLTKKSIILANLPYVPETYEVNSSANLEPRIAIFGGPDGLDLYRKMFKQTLTFDEKPQYILTESLPFQHKVLATLAKKHHYDLIKEEDFIQVFEAN